MTTVVQTNESPKGSAAANPAKQQAEAILMILDAIVDSIKAAGSHGAPGGILYSALMAQGCTLNQFHSLMGILINSGRVTMQGQLYFAV